MKVSMPGEEVTNVWPALVKATLTDAELGDLEKRINRLVVSEFMKFQRYLAHVDCLPHLGCSCGLTDLLMRAYQVEKVASSRRGRR